MVCEVDYDEADAVAKGLETVLDELKAGDKETRDEKENHG